MRRNRGEYMKNLKKLTILHSNDMHGDFLAEQIDERLVGGVSLLSGYVNKVRREEKNVIYAIAGDMFRGSVIDSEYKGTSTIGIMNLMGPDVATIGNHEVDYGLAHLLFLEKCADFQLTHGHAVAIGMVLMARAAEKLGWCTEPTADRIAVFEELGFLVLG